MAATTTLLGLVTPTQGTLSGTWGDTVNYGISDYVDISVAGTLTLTNDGAVTLANTTGSSAGSNITSSLTGAGTVTAQFAIVKVTGTLTVAKVVTGPSYSKTYTVVNAATGGIVTFKASGQTGVSVAVGESAFVYFNGTDYVKIVGTATAGAAGGSNTQVQFNSSGILSGSSSLTWDGTTLSSTQVNITGQGTLRLQDTTGGEYVALRAPATLGANYTLTFPADDGTSGQALITDGSGVLSWSTAASGDVYGPGSSTDNAVARFDSTTGKLLQNSVVLIGDTGAVTGVTDLTASGSVTLSGGTANGVAYLNGSKVVTSGSALTFDGTLLTTTAADAATVAKWKGTTGLLRLRPYVDATIGAIFESTNAAESAYLPLTLTGSNVFTNSDTAAIWKINNTEGMRLTSTGLGIGTSSPNVGGWSKALTIQGASNAAVEVTEGTVRTSLIAASTGLGFVSTDTNHPLVFRTNATERMRLDTSGNLGLGVTPSAWNSVYRALNIGSRGLIFSRTDNDETAIGVNWYRDAGASYVYTANGYASYYLQTGGAHAWLNAPNNTSGAGAAVSFTQAMTLDASGNLGVGTTSPSVRLHATGADQLLRLQNNNAYIQFANTANTDTAYIQQTASVFNIISQVNGAMVFGTNSTERARIDSSGNVGIGTTSPKLKLEVAGTDAAESGTATPNGAIIVGNPTASNSQNLTMGTLNGAGNHSWIQSRNSTQAAFYSLALNPSGGNVGIGTTAPVTALGFGESASGTGITFQSTNTTFNSGKVAVIKASITGSGNGSMVFETYAGGSGGGERARIDSSGNLGLGVTPSAWSSIFKAYQVGSGIGTAFMAGRSDAGAAQNQLGANAFYDGSWKYVGTGVASRYEQSSSVHSWHTAPSGTAGDAITFTQAMTLNASGQLLVGTTTASAKLTVSIADSAYSTPVSVFTNTDTGTGGYATTNWSSSASGSAVGYAGVGASAAGNASFRNAFVVGTGNATPLVFNTNDTEKARITSGGDLLVGTTSVINLAKFSFVGDFYNYNGLSLQTTNGGSGSQFTAFINEGGTVIGAINRVSTTNAVVYNTTSDYRLKTVTGTVTGQGARIDALKPIDYLWKDGNQQARGFLAHEFQTVYPNSVTGDKDAVDANGNPKYQAMQAGSSEVIADLVAEIQSLRKRLADAGI